MTGARVRRPCAARKSRHRRRALHPDLCGLVTARPSKRARQKRPFRLHTARRRRMTSRSAVAFPLGNGLHAIERIDRWGLGEVVRHPRFSASCLTFATHALAGPTADEPFVNSIRPESDRGQPVLDGRRDEGSDRRSRRHLADAVPPFSSPALSSGMCRLRSKRRRRRRDDRGAKRGEANRGAISRNSRNPSARSNFLSLEGARQEDDQRSRVELHSSLTVTASDAPLASITDTRAKPAPSGFQADCRRKSASATGAPLTNQVSGSAPPSAFS